MLQKRAQKHGFEFHALPGDASRPRAEGDLAADPPEPPDWVLLWGWGVMNSTAIKEAVAVGYPRDKMYRRVVVGRRARRDARPRTAPRATTRSRFTRAPASSRCSRTSEIRL